MSKYLSYTPKSVARPVTNFFTQKPEQFCGTLENICDVLSKFYCCSLCMGIMSVLDSIFGAVYNSYILI